MSWCFKIFYRVRAYGPGIEPTGPVVGAPAIFTVETFSAGKGKVDVSVENPKGHPEPVRLLILCILKFSSLLLLTSLLNWIYFYF